jgi:hypothetical protein
MSRSRLVLALVAALAIGAGVLPGALAAPGGGDAGGGAVLNRGRILMTVHPVDWVGLGSNAILANGLDVSLLSVAAAGEGRAGAAPTLPTSLYGKRLRLVEVEFCYDASGADVTLTQFLMRVDRNTTGTTKANPVAAAVDITERTDEACRTYPVDWALDPGDMAAASVSVDFGAPGASFQIGRLTFVLEPTKQASQNG